MTEDLKKQVNKLEREFTEFKYLFYKDNYSNLEVFRKKIQFNSDVNIGTALGAISNKLGFYTKSTVPITQQATFTAPTGGATVDAEARTAIGAIKTILTNLGLTT